MAAERAPAGLKQPSESHLHDISGARAPEIDGSAMRAARGEESYTGADHAPTSALAAPLAAGPARFGHGEEQCGRRPATARLASRAAVSCSGVLRSGSNRLQRSLARETWRLWRFSILLFIVNAYFSTSSTTPQIMASVVSIRAAMEAAF